MKPASTCPACDSNNVQSFFGLRGAPVHVGRHWPTAESARACPRGDIDLAFCASCGLVSNRTFDPTLLEYNGQYDNSLSFSAYYQQFARDLATRLIERYDVRHQSVVDIGCGDGDFLRLICQLGENAGTGFDPTCQNRGESSDEGRVRFVRDYYAPKYANVPADLVCCRHVFEHVPAPADFLRSLRRILGHRTDTAVYFEVPNLRTILRDLSVWTIIYEHCLYFSAESLARTFVSCGFDVLEVAECYDGQFLGLEARPATRPTGSGLGQWADLTDLTAAVASFVKRYNQTLETWRSRLHHIERNQAQAVAWGAGAKTVALFNTLNVTDQIPFVVDINPRKHGTHLAGTGQQIVPPAFLREHQPMVVVVMNEAYVDEIQFDLDRLGVSAELICA